MSFWQIIFLVTVYLSNGFSEELYKDRPKLYVVDGNLHMSVPRKKIISMDTSSFQINKIEVLTVMQQAQNATKLMESHQNFIAQYQSKIDDIIKQINTYASTPYHNLTYDNSTLALAVAHRSLKIKVRKLQRRISTLDRNLSALKTLLTIDECSSNPCKNGGDCIDVFNGYICKCLSGWEGSACEKDINECVRFLGTDLGCQNGGTCYNTPGSYKCACQNGWLGTHCDRKLQDCQSGGSQICEHGICVPQNNEAGYKCICDAGWQTDGTHLSCNIDVDECKLNHPPCSVNPLVVCVNVPGSFLCQHCPPGYTGNGYYCADINECELFNGGCSVSPFVECINTMGSSKCASCPIGYSGDGKTCTYRGVCNINNGGCNMLARCVDSSAITDTFVQCICPIGYSGSGIGLSGCTKLPETLSSCTPNPCVHGTCALNISTLGFTCTCATGFTGTYCDQKQDACSSSPCKNGATCFNQGASFVCKCVSGFSGKMCQIEKPACGGKISAKEGTIIYPPRDYQYSSNGGSISCAWNLVTTEDLVFEINFNKFNLTNEPCTKEWLQIHDGKNSLAPGLGRFCGKELPLNGSFTTTQHEVYFWLRSVGRTSGLPEFEISWTAKTPVCGGSILNSSGIITSPGWPNNYPNNRLCLWHIEADVDKRILFHIYSVDIGSNNECNEDYIEFYSPTYFADELNKRNLFEYICNSTIRSAFYSPFNEVTVLFKSDSTITHSGFQIGYSVVPGIPGCGGTFTNPSGIINSVDQVEPGDTFECSYLIKLRNNAAIILTFLEFDLCEGTCLSSVQIYQGSTVNSPLLGIYTGSSIPGPVETFGTSVLIVSKSDIYANDKWKIRYESVCTKIFNENSKTFHSVEDEECTYLIQQPAGYIIILDLQLNDLIAFGECRFYYVEIRDGDNPNAPLIGRYCNNTKVKIESSTNYLWIEDNAFPRDVTFNYTASYVGCGGLLKIDRQTISYPINANENYTPNAKCTWLIVAPPGYVIKLTWLTFNTEQSFECTYDRVEIYDNNTETGIGGLIGKYCGYRLPPISLSSSNIMTLKFMSDSSLHGEGFLASYIFLKEDIVCGGDYFTPAGVIKSPGYPKQYPSNRECIWTISVSPGNQISLNIISFNIESYAKCRYDYLEIRNGGTSSSPIIGQYCGTDIPQTIASHTNKLFLKFVSDASRTGQGFKIKWSSASTGCGGTLISPTGSIMSPHYPEPYARNTDCIWKIVVNSGSKVQVTFADIDLEKHNKCSLDYIQIFDGPTIKSKSLGKFCTAQRNAIVSSSNTIVIRFRSDVSFQGRGFHIQYSIVCKNTLTGFSGVIESPNFPNEYPNDEECIWEIKVTERNKINITFSHFNLERSITYSNQSCKYDYLEIEYLKTYEDFETYGRYCSDKSPGLITLDSNHAKIHFVSDSLLLGTGFRLEWQLEGCGGVKTSKTGVIRTPNYPNPYVENLECHWLIKVPLGNAITITFNEIDTEKDGACNFDYVKIYDGRDETYNLITHLCAQSKPVTVSSNGNEMFIKFQADYAYQGRGFSAYYSTIKSKCGGVLTSTSGYIYSPNYPKNFNHNDVCEWLINTDPNHVVELQFLDVDIEKHADCNKTFIKVYDGPTQAYPILQTICGSTETWNTSITSTFENVLVEFRNSYYLTSKGFKATYRKACGATIKANGNGIIKLENGFDFTYGDFPGSVSCTFIIEADNPSKHVTVTFGKMIYGWCNVEDPVLKVYGGASLDSPLIGQYCSEKLPAPITSDGSVLRLEFNDKLEFFATYSVLDDACGGTIEAFSGYIATPGWPKSYPNNAFCTWIVSLGPGNTVTINSLNFDIPQSEYCNTDYLEIREKNDTGKLLGVYCGTVPLINVTSPSGKLFLTFKSSKLDEGVPTNDKGFHLEFSTSYDNVLTGPSGQISNPYYPSTFIGHEIFSWLITTKPDTRIEITFNEFQFVKESIEGCYGSSFSVFNGLNEEAPLLAEHCGIELPPAITSTSNIIYIKAGLFSERLDTKFLVSWKELYTSLTPNNKQTCQFIYTVNSTTNVTVSSPNYPSEYKKNLNCEWIFETTEEYHLKVQFLDIDISAFISNTWCPISRSVTIYKNSYETNNWELIKSICQPSEVKRDFFGSNKLKLVFRSNILSKGKGFQAVVSQVCGGRITKSSGFIIFDKHNSPETICEWYLTVRSGHTISLTFEKFDLGQINSNCPNYLIIRNGKFSTSPFLDKGKYCASNSNPTVSSSTSNHLYIKYNGSTSIQGFRIRYKENTFDCGGEIALTSLLNSTEIVSPNYPNIPMPHSECIWIFTAPRGERMRIDFEERFDLTNSPKCNEEYVEIRDGATERSSLFGRFCYDMPSTIFTTDNMLRIKYFTDVEEPRNGFKLKVSLSYCGGTIYGLRGELDSSIHPGGLQLNTNCTWRIKVPTVAYIEVRFTKLRIGMNRNCSSYLGSVHFYELTSYIRNDLGTFCGRKVPINIITSIGNEMIINYIPKSLQDGFAITFESKRSNCSREYIQESGTITSPDYPFGKRISLLCEWKIKVPKGRRISISVEDIDYYPLITDIFNGWNTDQKITDIFTVRQIYQSSDNRATIRYGQTEPPNKDIRGLKLTFTSLQESVCLGNFNQTEGIITTPTNASFYLCEWIFDRDLTGTSLSVSVIFETNEDSKATCSNSNTGIKLLNDPLGIETYVCQNTTHGPYAIISPYPLTLTARKNKNVYTNFMVTYKTYPCGGVIRHEKSTISSPNIMNAADSVMKCSWLIRVNQNRRIKINVTYLNLHDNCDDNHLIIYNGNWRDHPRIGRYCKNNIPAPFISQRNIILIEYKNDVRGETSMKGFKLTYESSSTTCGGIIHSNEITIQTPNYNNGDYSNNTECLWELEAPVGNLIILKFKNKFHIEESTNCTKDFIEIFDWKYNEWVSTGKRCGRITPNDIKTSNNRMRILFRSDNNITAFGFMAYWDWMCGGEFIATPTEQYIFSPGYPKQISANLSCTYEISAKNNELINARFLDFDLKEGCEYSNLTIQSGRYRLRQVSILNVYCGTTYPPFQRDRGIKFTLKTSNDFDYYGRGFKMVYTIERCGGNITSPTEIDLPSLQPNRLTGIYIFHTSLKCKWFITAPPNQIPIISLKQVGIAQHYDSCSISFLQIYTNETNDDANLVAKFCYKINDTIIPGSTNKMLMVLESIPSLFEGFKAEIYFTYGPEAGCGGTINLTETSLEKTLYSPDNLPQMDCYWKIIAPIDYKIEIQFSSIKMTNNCNGSNEKNNNTFCKCSFIEVKDGAISSADLITKLCSNNKSTSTYVTSWNTGYIRLYSSISQNNIFTLHLKAVLSKCGTSLFTVSNKTQIITSPNYPNPYPNDISCRWILVKNKGRIRVHFDVIDLLNETSPIENTQCIQDRIEISDDPNKHIIAEGFLLKSKLHYFDVYDPYKIDKTYQLCGKSDQVFDFYSAANNISIVFKSFPLSIGQKGKGFKLEFEEAGCNRTIFANEGRIENMDINMDSTQGHCYMTITSDINSTLSLYFITLASITSNCSNAYFEVNEYNTTGIQLLKTCGHRRPNPVFSNTNQIQIHTYANQLDPNSKMWVYNFLYVSSKHGKGCGGKLYNYLGTFTSPLYPFAYQNDEECKWDVKVPAGYKVAFRFSVFDITGNCDENNVIITTYTSNKSTQHKFCSKDDPADLISDGHLQVTYQSSQDNQGTGWIVVFEATKEETSSFTWYIP